VGQCRYSKCRGFFLIEQRGAGEGRPNRLYCSREVNGKTHAQLANEEQSKGRQNKARARKALKAEGYSHDEARDLVERSFEQHPQATAKQLADHARALPQSARRHK
jgi:hypothetical protein